jgi:ADP-ribose pyrophosphatase
MPDSYEIKKITNEKWVNLYNVTYSRKSKPTHNWQMCSRKERPVKDASIADAVVVVPIIDTPDGKRLVVTREFRVPIWDYEYGFPAGLIDDGEDIEKTVRRELKEETGLDVKKIIHVSMPVYSSAGLSDESCYMVLVEAAGQVSNIHLDHMEDIEVCLMDVQQIKDLLASKEKVAAKAWGILYHFASIGKINF